MSRESMTPPNSGRPMRPGQDCPNCAAPLVTDGKLRVCSSSCGHRQAAPQ